MLILEQICIRPRGTRTLPHFNITFSQQKSANCGEKKFGSLEWRFSLCKRGSARSQFTAAVSTILFAGS